MSSFLPIDVSQVRMGMYIQLDVGWMRHPFPVNSFRITNQEQLDTLRSLNLAQVRWSPAKSDLAVQEESTAPQAQDSAPPVESTPSPTASAPQDSTLQACERRFSQATQDYVDIAAQAFNQPQQARARTEALVAASIEELLDHGEVVIRLLSEDVGVRSALHPVNVMVLSLLLGRAQGLDSAQLHTLGLAALLHDVGKQALPAHVREPYAQLSADEVMLYRSHVEESRDCILHMGLPAAVAQAVAQHHERADRSGFPARLEASSWDKLGQIVALVNHYERLCNPSHGGACLTPHEALSVMFAQHQGKFDPGLLGIFIRMMGVYPPGSVVQLVDERYAIVVSVNPARPLRPRIVVYDRSIPKEQAQVWDLEELPGVGIRRSLRPPQLPREVLDYLSPRQRICYFFERAVGSMVSGGVE